MPKNKYILIEHIRKKDEAIVLCGEGEIRSFFELYLTLNNVKNISYFDVQTETAESIIEIAESIGLAFIQYGGEVDDILMVGYDNIVRLIHILITLNYMESDVFDLIIGTLCNIPSCCIEKYIAFDRWTTRMFDDYTRQLNGRKDPYGLKKEGDTVEREYINYIPCSPVCKKTKIRYASYKKLWKCMFDSYGVDGAKLKKIGVDVEKVGIVTLEDYDRSLS